MSELDGKSVVIGVFGVLGVLGMAYAASSTKDEPSALGAGRREHLARVQRAMAPKVTAETVEQWKRDAVRQWQEDQLRAQRWRENFYSQNRDLL